MVSGLLMLLKHLGGKANKKDRVLTQPIQDFNRKCATGLAYTTKCVIIQTTKWEKQVKKTSLNQSQHRKHTAGLDS